MKTFITTVALLLVTAINMSGQNIRFSYDADGNMTSSNYVSTLRSSDSEEEENTVIAKIPEREIYIYPNPTQGHISMDITLLNEKEDNYFQLYNTAGQLIKSQKITSSRTEFEITGDKGIYLLNIHTGNDVSKWKIIKQ